MLRQVLKALLATVLLLAGPLTAFGRTRDLSADEAHRLVIQALYPTERGLPGLDAELNQSTPIPGFYRFDVNRNNPNSGSVVVGAFAMNRATGDVWELVLCRKKRSKELRSLQPNLRKLIGLSGEELRKLGDRAPCEP